MCVAVLLHDPKLPRVRETSYVAADARFKINPLKLRKDRKTVSVELVGFHGSQVQIRLPLQRFMFS